MYPDWPQSDADLVPLPHCDGPKLKPFDFHGPQKIEFLEYLGEGMHAHVIKVKIQGQIYALKLFRFVYDHDWLGPEPADEYNLEAMRAFYNYSEPFSAECRAFGRLHETGHAELAVQCFGYLLLDEEHESAMMKQFVDRNLRFEGNMEQNGFCDHLRSRFLGKDGRPPPIRAIVKGVGQTMENMRTRHFRKIFRDIIGLQQLGIISLDVFDVQLVDRKLCDFSTAITLPHFITTPELNPCLTPEWVSAIEFETFQLSRGDYFDFDDMVLGWNHEHKHMKDQVSFWAFPNHGCPGVEYDLRSKPSRELIYSFVDPRQFDWKASANNPGNAATKTLVRDTPTSRRSSRIVKRQQRTVRTSTRLLARPDRWVYNGSEEQAKKLKNQTMVSTSLQWEFKDGLIYPRKKKY